ncbi:MAG: PAS domain S-box protein [Terriglobales bacterium]|jgi:PAS domain S-box-containing protein
MALHPGERKRHFPEEAPVAWDPIRRDLEEDEDWYRDLVEHSQDLLCVHDLEGRFLSVNPIPARLLGYSVEEMLQRPMREFVDPQFRPEFDAYLREIKRTGESCGLLAVLTRSGEQRIWEYHNTLRTEGVARPTVRGIAHDVTERVRAEKALRASNEEQLKTARQREQTLRELTLFRTLLDQSNDAIQVMDPETLRFLDVNERACAGLGYSREELLSMTVFDIDPNADECAARVRQQLRESGFAIMETVHRRKDGTTFPVEVNLRRVRLDREYSVAVSRDITTRKRAEERLREFERVVENLEEMIVVVDRDYRYVLANRAFLSYRRTTKEQVVGRFVGELVNPEQYETVVKERLVECFQGKVVNYELKYLYPEIGERDISITYLPVEGSTGIDCAACVMRDITERKRAAEALRQSEARERARAKELETVLDTVPVPVLIARDAECRRITGNRAAHEQMRVPAGQNLSKSAPPEERPRYRLMLDGVEVPVDLMPMQQAAATGKPVYGRAVTLGFEDGIERETVVNAVPLLDEEGKTRGAVGSSVDLTELKQAEKALRESELRFRTVYERSPVGIALVDSHGGQILQVNPKYCEITGRSEEELLGIDVRSITHPDDIGQTSGILQQLAEEKLASYETEKRYIRPDGSVRWVTILVVPMWGKGETHRWQMGLARDITEQKQAEEALRESERRHQLALQIGRIGAFELDLESGRGTWTAEFAEIWGIPSGYAGDFASFFSWEMVHPADRARVQEEFAQLAQSREEGESEFRVIRPDGVMRCIRGRGRVIADSAAGSLRIVGVIQDITEQKRAEEAITTLVQVRADSSENFFHSMAGQLAKCLEADYTLIGEVTAGEEDKVRTIGVCDHGASAENFTYDLAHTPSEAVMLQGACSYAAGVSEMFPKDVWLKQMKMKGYAGTPLRDSQGRVIGMMVALYTRPLANAKFAEAILQLFSTRTAAEIERKRTEEALQQSEERFRVALLHSPIAVFNQDRDLRYTWMYNSQLPLPASELGKTVGEIFDPEEAARITEVRRRVLETGVGARDEMQVTFGGRKQYFSTTIEPLLDSAGAVIGLTGASMDVTELREASEALREAKKKLTEEKLYLEQEIDTELGFGDIIGHSKALESVMENVGKVASSNATVLLLGETGTGKELVARAVHWLSQRSGNSFIKLNCAAIPTGLLESELFGNEKGAFTGAVSRKFGRLELADKGTLFLDEIGEISLTLQPKLLRVLQDQEFERLGGTQTLKVDFRLIAATNRDLADAVRKNEFRSDLYYRLNVFPIRVPPLRERREDIPLLVEHFVQKFARRMKKSITSIPKRTMDALRGWEWPGNVRELENFIERSVILTQGSVLVAPLSEMELISTTEEKSVNETLEAAEREHILRALRESRGQIGGLKGAAMRLGLKRTTLQSKLKHLGINPRSGQPGH